MFNGDSVYVEGYQDAFKLQFMKMADKIHSIHIKNIVIYQMFRMEGQCFEELYDGSTFCEK